MNQTDPTPSLWQMMFSVLAAFFGVQSSSKHARDFTHGKFHQFVILGLIGTVLFVLVVWGVVKLVLGLAGA
jgi:hypothetical protein